MTSTVAVWARRAWRDMGHFRINVLVLLAVLAIALWRRFL